jgi:imidazolonepropionase-like amidohydrolase
MVEHAITFVPTMTILPLIAPLLDVMGLSPTVAAEAKATVGRHPELVARAADAGVRVLAGTDAGMVPHGIVSQEVANLRGAGLSAQRALGAASWDARAYLGMAGIEEGAPADLVVFADDDSLDRPLLRILDGGIVT